MAAQGHSAKTFAVAPNALKNSKLSIFAASSGVSVPFSSLASGRCVIAFVRHFG